MALHHRQMVSRLFYCISALILAILLISAVRHLSVPPTPLDKRSFSPKPPFLLEPNPFSCINSPTESRRTKRFAFLQGPDWKIESAINPKCFPERDLTFSTEEGKRLLPHPLLPRIKFWITKRNDRIYVYFLNSSGNDDLDDAAIELVTNHRCRLKSRGNCRIRRTNSNLRID